jgi:autoinducer 2-degrading protein
MKGIQMYAVTVTFHIHPEQIDAFLPLMIDNVRMSRTVETGCQHFDICRDGADVFLYELYDDRAAFDAHLASTHFKTFDRATAAMIAAKDVRLFEDVIR